MNVEHKRQYALWDGETLSIGADVSGLTGPLSPVGSFSQEQEARAEAIRRGCLFFNSEPLRSDDARVQQTIRLGHLLNHHAEKSNEYAARAMQCDHSTTVKFLNEMAEQHRLWKLDIEELSALRGASPEGGKPGSLEAIE